MQPRRPLLINPPQNGLAFADLNWKQSILWVMRMANRRAFAAALIITTALGGGVLAADQIVRHSGSKANSEQAAVDRDVGKLSKDGAQGFRDLQLARVAIYNADPSQAKSMIAKAQTAFTKAKTDDAVFTKAEAELKTADELPNHKASAQPAKAEAKPTSKEPIAWVPVDAQITLGEDFLATPEKAAAITEANKSLAKGDRKGALEKLTLAHVDVNFTMAVLPLDKTLTNVDQAAKLIGQDKYYEANQVLKQAQDSMRFDAVDAIAFPQKAAAAAGDRTSPQATGTTAAKNDIPQGKRDEMSMKETKKEVTMQENENKESNKNVDSLITNRN